MKKLVLTVDTREVGKGVSRRIRKGDKIPAVLYGKSVKPIPIIVDRAPIEKIIKGSDTVNAMIDMTVAGGDSGLAVIRDYQADPIKRKLYHVDFQAVGMADRIAVEIPIEVTGTSIGVKEGGVLELQRRSLHVKAIPDKIPACITLDISALDIGDSIHADEVVLPDDVEFLHKRNYTVISVVPPAKIEATPAEVAAAATAEGAEGEVDAVSAAEGEKDVAATAEVAPTDNEKGKDSK